ncbi:zinc finger HIT domain-containing protein 2 isoform X2 [Oratosquilla oratoria]
MASSTTSKSSCAFCPKEQKYTCPQCSNSYCSLVCYRHPDHGSCTETFYKNWVEEEMKSISLGKDSQKKVLEMLQRVENKETNEEEPLDSDDDEDEEDLAVRMKDINLDDCEAVWAKLSDQEKLEFQSFIKAGKLNEIVPEWTPWWLEKQSLVKELKEQADRDSTVEFEFCPQILEVPHLSQFHKGVPSKSLPFNIINVIAAYVSTIRAFNGDHHDDCLETCTMVFALCPVLSVNATFSDAASAVLSVVSQAQSNVDYTECVCEEALQKDVIQLLKGPSSTHHTYFARAALSDVHNLLLKCKKELSRKSRRKDVKGPFSTMVERSYQRSTQHEVTGDKVKAAIKKLEFFLSYVLDHGQNLQIASGTELNVDLHSNTLSQKTQ